MLSRIPRSVQLAGAVFLALLAYFLIRTSLGQVDSRGSIVAPASVNRDIPTVAVTPLRAEIHSVVRSFKGRTEADRTVIVRTETPGIVRETPVEDGTMVSEGVLLCGLNVDAREARLAEAKATAEASRIEYEAALGLSESGFSSSNRLAGAKASLDRAEAGLNAARIELSRTNVRAPFSGVFEERYANVGDFLKGGDPCGKMVDLDPIVIVANESEDMIAEVKTGLKARVRLADGRELDGKVSFISRAANEATRTFRIETQVSNSDYSVSAGLTSELFLTLRKEKAILISSASLALSDDGIVGVRHVDAFNMVQFAEVRVIDDGPDGIWVAGLPDRVDLIAVGQDFIREGTRVNAVRIAGR